MTAFAARLRCLFRDRRGNVLMMFGFALLPLTFAVGMGIDYARAMTAQTKLNAIADASALVAVSKLVMPFPDVMAAEKATMMFTLQSQPVLGAGSVRITRLVVTAVKDATGRRTATVTYKATSDNVFARILGLNVLNIGGTSTTTNAIAPNINFYVLLDVSGSMALPSTSAGLRIVANSNARGCKFACHSVNDEKGTDKNGNQVSLYDVARSYGLTLRIDEEASSVNKLADTAISTMSRNGAMYQMAISTFRGSGGFATPMPLTPKLSMAYAVSPTIQPSTFYKNGCPTQACQRSEVGWNDQDSAHSDAFDNMNAMMGTPGSGVNGDNPKGVMFIVTDGMRDENRPGSKPEAAIDTAKCDAIKARGIRIAVLYTEYLRESLDNDSWSQTNVAPNLYKVEPALQACASSGLYTKVSTDGDISAALSALFQNAVATARISQ
ncbi:hypothetical protein DC429_12215 [Arthrobacter sp. TPD3018]|uniref:TadE/TadG family type IV pilus assembly protein n=1 Tax=Bacteria TaxID=2 RepID=UPI000D521491|nr:MULTISPECIES: TadE/TadG family type IV pilus assembly protein [Bacteria]PVE53471.1 hypothetical protein DC425_13775 [Sphingomonas sp. TPD3009]PVE56090.1 hypothetical protein DC429_12215 [Arthrobacter sp. TPD3018]PVE81690.1 hypothetical protein DC431_13590 [Sphingomonas melonis]